mmetsp:Transcript_74078/g.162113  ORF Transcript_74078/g.162113 Transcript_74078/m.162113 type:complete len:625 (-) Transcript_74078:114-1988(-)
MSSWLCAHRPPNAANAKSSSNSSSSSSKNVGSHCHVIQVAVGKEHGLLLTDEGVVYSWGVNNGKGQLGRGENPEEPAPITSWNKGKDETDVMVQIACGREHSLALSQSGVLYAWGSNKAGQLGLGLSSRLKEVRIPTPVVLSRKDPSIRVKSCSCAPESSACVTTTGEVYVWGATSYYLFDSGGGYIDGENCGEPVKVRGVPSEENRMGRDGFMYAPASVAICREQLACTIRPEKLEDELATIRVAMKARSSHLISIKTRGLHQASAQHVSHDAFNTSEVKGLDEEFHRQMLEFDAKLRELKESQSACEAELHRLGREITVCDQQDTALSDNLADLEVKRSKLLIAEAGRSAGRNIDIQLNDIGHFKNSTYQGRLALMAERDEQERKQLNLMQEVSALQKQREHVQALSKLVKALKSGALSAETGTSTEEAVSTTDAKRLELSAAEPQILAKSGNFTGLHEVLAVSNLALGDVSSALREVSAVAGTTDGGLLEEVLEANLKLRQEINNHIQAKISKCYQGDDRTEGLASFFFEQKKDGLRTAERHDRHRHSHGPAGVGRPQRRRSTANSEDPGSGLRDPPVASGRGSSQGEGLGSFEGLGDREEPPPPDNRRNSSGPLAGLFGW